MGSGTSDLELVCRSSASDLELVCGEQYIWPGASTWEWYI